ncbi:hypothetical protein JYU34_007453 [Plutella xylostella]|uniref:Uncharacterized protein n=1 Tax=Plutella xylostella TaxID=51655 RepID=A0ABQ7QQH4_PLUXY|nr:hypothetical protein JYU34_007453 [Plutella xylostella]
MSSRAHTLHFTTSFVKLKLYAIKTESAWRCFDVGVVSYPRAPDARRRRRRSLRVSALAPRRRRATPARHAATTTRRDSTSASAVSMMRKSDSQGSVRGARSSRLMDSVSSDEGPETERLLAAQLPPGLVQARRQSLTAPPSPTDSRKKLPRHHNYMNHLHHFIHWRDIWGGEPHTKGQEVPRSLNSITTLCPASCMVLSHNCPVDVVRLCVM